MTYFLNSTPIKRIYEGEKLVYEAPAFTSLLPDKQPLTAFIPGLVTGDRIELFRAANIRREPIISTSTLIGVNASGMRGTIRGGPTTGISNSIWYDINFDGGHDGWCVSDNYTQTTNTTPTELTPSIFRVGDRIRLVRASNIRTNQTIGTASLKGVNPANAQGVITAGPVKSNNINWYNINFDAGQDGWCASDNYVRVEVVGGVPGGVPVTPIIPGTCNRPLWSPSNDAMCGGRWGILAEVGGSKDDRLSCAVAPGGGTALQISELAGRHLSLMSYSQDIAAARSENAVMVQMEMFFPTDFVAAKGQRFPLGIRVRGNGNGCGGTGGCLPEDASGSTIRLSGTTSGGSYLMSIYSYHLDRTNASEVRDSQYGNGVKERQSGAVKRLSVAVPKGQWVTVAMRLVLNTPGQANGSSTIWLYNSAGNLLGTTSWTNVTYRRDSSWVFQGFYGDTKSAGSYVPPRNQSYYVRNYKMFGC